MRDVHVAENLTASAGVVDYIQMALGPCVTTTEETSIADKWFCEALLISDPDLAKILSIWKCTRNTKLDEYASVTYFRSVVSHALGS